MPFSPRHARTKAVSWRSLVVTLSFDMFEECFRAPAIVLCPEGIGLERLFQRLVELTEIVEGCAPQIRRLSCFGSLIHFRMAILDRPVVLVI